MANIRGDHFRFYVDEMGSEMGVEPELSDSTDLGVNLPFSCFGYSHIPRPPTRATQHTHSQQPPPPSPAHQPPKIALARYTSNTTVGYSHPNAPSHRHLSLPTVSPNSPPHPTDPTPTALPTSSRRMISNQKSLTLMHGAAQNGPKRVVCTLITVFADLGKACRMGDFLSACRFGTACNFDLAV